VDDKLAILDVRAMDESGRMCNIEMQMQMRQMYSRRALYYWAAQYRSQLDSGDDYRQLRPTFGIHFLNHVLYRHDSRYHRQFQLLDPDEPSLRLNEDLEIHILELPKFLRKVDELQDKLEEWCYFLRFADALVPSQLPDRLRNPDISHEVEVLRAMTEHQKAYWQYEDRLKALRDYRSDLNQARDEGLQLGEKVGTEKGMNESDRRNAIEFILLAQTILRLSPDEFAGLQELPLESLKEIATTLKNRMLQDRTT
jgi:predicted transposase/invertase (TIGR01784 family)